jgi:hypothetical protein
LPDAHVGLNAVRLPAHSGPGAGISRSDVPIDQKPLRPGHGAQSQSLRRNTTYSPADMAIVTSVEVQKPHGWANPGYGTFCP